MTNAPKIRAAITGVGAYLPEGILTNADLEKTVDTNDEWIRTRTGIEQRHILREPGAGTSFMAIRAAKQLLKKNEIDPKTIDLVIVATVTPDNQIASTAVYTATEIGAVNAFGFDIQAACSGFLYGMSTAAKFIESGRYKRVLLIGADKMSSIIDYEDRATCIIFGDGAGAVLFEPDTEGNGVVDEYLRSDGAGREFLYIEAGGSTKPPTAETVAAKEHFVKQDGKTVFKYAVANMVGVSREILKRNEMTAEDISWFAPHQANQRIIDAVASRVGLSGNAVMSNIARYGNTTAGTLPLLLSDYESQFKKGDSIVFITFGAGFTWGALLLRWAYDG